MRTLFGRLVTSGFRSNVYTTLFTPNSKERYLGTTNECIGADRFLIVRYAVLKSGVDR